MPDYEVLTLYEPRWHGFAKWTLEWRQDHGAVIWRHETQRGWWRPPTGWKYREVRVDA